MTKWDLPKGWKIGNFADLPGSNGLITDGDWILNDDLKTGDEVRLIQLADIGEGEFLDKSNKHISKKRALELKCTFLESGDILISRLSDPLLKSCILPESVNDCITAVDVSILRPDISKYDIKYVNHYLNSNVCKEQARKYSVGTTRKRISRKNIEKIKIPIPPLETQQKIVAILDKAEKIKRLRAEANAQTQKLIQSVFLDMFGDPMKNTKNFEKRRLGDLVDSIKKVDSSLLDQFHYIDIDSVDNYLNIISNPKIIAGTEAPSRARQLVRKDDILFSTVRPYLKNIAIVPEYLDGQVASTGFCIIRSKIPEFVPFLFHLLLSDSFVDSLKEFYRGANYPAISPKDLMDYRIPFPSIDLLVKFNSRSRQIDTNLKNQRKFLNEMTRFDELLTSKAFTGELVA
ncbi:Type I restriction modification DNA specificity domain protein [anaerobic digester metagenome]